jgi:phenylpropionate dioxygenase-like ring-hydroxylating dioxygenase large terminal subunit
MEALIPKVLERIKGHLKNGTTDTVTRSSSKTSEYYLCLDQFQKEKRFLFQGLPLPVALSAQIPKPDDWITLEDYRIPLILNRDSNGKVHAFSNRCRHRGSKVLLESKGRGRCFSCPYHAWTYNQEGQLVGIPHSKGFPDLSHSELGLVSFPIVESNGILWLQYDSGTSQVKFETELNHHLEGVEGDLAGLHLDQTQCVEIVEFTCKANWKILVEAFLEGYHIPMAHRKTLAPGVIDNLFIQDALGRHSRSFYPLKKIQKMIEDPVAPIEKIMAGVSIIYHLFPNTLLAVEPFQFSSLHFIPIDISSTLVRMTILANPLSQRDPEKFEKERNLLKAGVQEDLKMGEAIQSNLDSGQNFEVHFGLFEGMITHFHSVLDGLLGSSLKME